MVGTLRIRVVLVEPIYEGNVGSVARVMKNFGFCELVLVNPCKLGNQARAMSMHAYDVLTNARIAGTLADAVSGSDITVATTGLPGKTAAEHVRMPALSPCALRQELSGRQGTVSIVFGREDIGLVNDELSLCDIIASIPTSTEYPSMNLSHAVAVMLYELSDIAPGPRKLAPHAELEYLYKHFEELLLDIDYKRHKEDKTLLMLRRIFGRAGLTGREVMTLRGVLRRIQRALGTLRD